MTFFQNTIKNSMTKTPDMKATDEIIAMLERAIQNETLIYARTQDEDLSNWAYSSIVSLNMALDNAKNIRSRHER